MGQAQGCGGRLEEGAISGGKWYLHSCQKVVVEDWKRVLCLAVSGTYIAARRLCRVVKTLEKFPQQPSRGQ